MALILPYFLTALLGCVAGAVIGLAVMLTRESRRPRLLCLMYHRLGTPEAHEAADGVEKTFLLPVDEFDRQLAYLAQAGYRFVTPDEALLFAEGRSTLDGPAVMITFDDGCRSVVSYGSDVLTKHGAVATVFVTTDPKAGVFRIGAATDPRIDDNTLREIDRGAFRIESHTVSHNPLTSLAPEDLDRELIESKRTLESLTGRPVSHLALPGNWYDRRVLSAARRAGYQAVWSSMPGSVLPGANLFPLPRVNVDGDSNLERFRRQLTPTRIVQRRVLLSIRRLPGRLLGARLWTPLHARIMRLMPGGHFSMRRMAAVTAAMLILLTTIVVVLLWRGM